MLSRTDRCKHPINISCAENVLVSFYKTFINMLGIKIFLNNIGYITNIKKLLKNLTNHKANYDHFMFALFFASMNSSYKLVLCFLRRFIKRDQIIAPIAGFIAGLFSILD